MNPVAVLPALVGHLLGSLINLSGPGHYFNWGFIQISYANIVVIGLMILVFLGAILIPFRRHRSEGK